MAWQAPSVGLLSGTEEGRILINIINSLARELARLQEEIDELRRKQK